MQRQPAAATWHVFGESVLGTTHEHRGQPNEDALGWAPTGASTGTHLALALSDGHGGALYFRSTTGAHLAVQTALQLGGELAFSQGDTPNLPMLKRTVTEWLPRRLVHTWQQNVHTHLADHPFTAAERDALWQAQGAAGLDRIDANPLLAYAATMLLTLVMPGCLAYLQLGDGDILTVSDNYAVGRTPIPGDERVFGHETEAMCGPDAWRDMRTYVHIPVGPPPALIILATDGYARSFANSANFYTVGTDMLAMLRHKGREHVCAHLPAWLKETSQQGSGEDITLGILYRPVP